MADFEVVGQYGPGSVAVDELNEELARAWAAAVSDPASKSEIAKALSIDENKLSATKPIFQFKTGESAGLDGVSVAVIAITTTIVSELFVDVAKDIAKDAIRAGLKKVWVELLKVVRRKQKRDAVGDEVETG